MTIREIHRLNLLGVRVLEKRVMLRQAAQQAVQKSAYIAKESLKDAKYVALNFSIQLAVEAIARKDELFDSANPIIVAENVLTNKDLLQNLGYMTAETLIASRVQDHIHSIPKKLMVSGLISITNSLAMNLLVRGEKDPVRTGIDSSWEVLIGNSQILADHIALDKGVELARRTNNPKLKWIGWAFVLLDQAAGYVGYNQATSGGYAFLDEKYRSLWENPKVLLKPVFVSADFPDEEIENLAHLPSEN